MILHSLLLMLGLGTPQDPGNLAPVAQPEAALDTAAPGEAAQDPVPLWAALHATHWSAGVRVAYHDLGAESGAEFLPAELDGRLPADVVSAADVARRAEPRVRDLHVTVWEDRVLQREWTDGGSSYNELLLTDDVYIGNSPFNGFLNWHDPPGNLSLCDMSTMLMSIPTTLTAGVGRWSDADENVYVVSGAEGRSMLEVRVLDRARPLPLEVVVVFDGAAFLHAWFDWSDAGDERVWLRSAVRVQTSQQGVRLTSWQLSDVDLDVDERQARLHVLPHQTLVDQRVTPVERRENQDDWPEDLLQYVVFERPEAFR